MEISSKANISFEMEISMKENSKTKNLMVEASFNMPLETFTWAGFEAGCEMDEGFSLGKR
jgi:hypothetical protein